MSLCCRLLIFLVFGPLLLGCQFPRPSEPIASQIPVPAMHALKTQKKMQSMQHWELLAADIANQIQDYIKTENDMPWSNIFVAPAGNTSFEKTFYDLLITKMVEKELTVSKHDKNALIVSFDLEMVKHTKRMLREKRGVYKSLAPGVYVKREKNSGWSSEKINTAEKEVGDSTINVDAGLYTEVEPQTEVMITVSLTKNDKYLFRASSIYYINQQDWQQYEKNLDNHEPNLVKYKLVDD